jgi:hypothetical protein
MIKWDKKYGALMDDKFFLKGTILWVILEFFEGFRRFL